MVLGVIKYFHIILVLLTYGIFYYSIKQNFLFAIGCFAIIVLQFVYLLVRAILSALSGNIIIKVKNYFLPIIIGLTLHFVTLAGIKLNNSYHVYEIAKIKILRDHYQYCIDSAITYNTGKFNVCESQTGNDAGFFFATSFVKTIIYDSSGEIVLPVSKRSDQWKNTVYKFQDQAPFGLMGYNVKHLIGHFYIGEFSSDQPADF